MSELVEVVFVFADVTNPKQNKKKRGNWMFGELFPGGERWNFLPTPSK